MRRLALLLVVTMLLTACVAGAEEASSSAIVMQSVALREDNIGIQAGTEVTVGSVTELSGRFAMDLWGNNTADMDIRMLLHGYSTIAWTSAQSLTFNGVAVAGVQVMQADNGNRIYVISLMTDLVYNDGTPITAKDYVFSLLLQGAPQVNEIGGMPRGLEHIAGFDAYLAGEAEVFSGVRLLSESAFSLEVQAEYLPFFYGLSMLEVTPYPMAVIAPGCDIYDDGEGAYIARGESADAMDAVVLGFEPGVFSAQMLEKTLLDPEDGYVSHPYVTSGAYSLESYDAEAKTVTLVANPLYLGNYEGQRPHIERVTMRAVTNDNMIALLEAGEVDILNKVVSGGAINAGIAMMGGEEVTVRGTNYLRTGMAFLSFACEQGVTQYPEVRQAIARAVDKAGILKDITLYGRVVHGYYGLGQWMATYGADEDEEAGLPAVNTSVMLEELAVAYDLDAARAILDENGWTLNDQGGTYVEGQGAVRHKNIDGTLIPLVIHWAKTEDSTAADAVHAHIGDAFAQVGIGLEIEEMPFSQLLLHYYRQEPRTYDMFFMASNFLSVFDPYYDYNTADEYQGLVNTTGLRDAALMEFAREMRETDSMSLHAYSLKWLAFQERWVELMPMVPLYSSIYYDFFAADIQDYRIDQNMSWSEAIQYAWIGQEGDYDVAPEGDGEIVIEDEEMEIEIED